LSACPSITVNRSFIVKPPTIIWFCIYALFPFPTTTPFFPLFFGGGVGVFWGFGCFFFFLFFFFFFFFFFFVFFLLFFCFFFFCGRSSGPGSLFPAPPYVLRFTPCQNHNARGPCPWSVDDPHKLAETLHLFEFTLSSPILWRCFLTSLDRFPRYYIAFPSVDQRDSLPLTRSFPLQSPFLLPLHL